MAACSVGCAQLVKELAAPGFRQNSHILPIAELRSTVKCCAGWPTLILAKN
jgi:hypothetical protein